MRSQLFKLFLPTLLITFSSIFVYAQTEREKGIEYYNQGNDRAAIIELKSALKKQKNDAELLNYLGNAFLNVNEYKNARKSFEKAVNANPQNATFRTNLAFAYFLERKFNEAQSELEKAILLDPSNAKAYYIRGKVYLYEKKLDKAIEDVDTAIRIKPTFAEAYLLKSDILLASFGNNWFVGKKAESDLYLLEDAVKELNKCSGNCLTEQNKNLFRERLQNIQSFVDYFRRKNPTNSQLPIEDTNERTPIKILSKPEPRYTDAARQANVQGFVVLALLLGADGEIKHIIVLSGLSHGLTEQAIAAARKLRFEPEKFKGEPVSTVRSFQYRFAIY